MNNVWKVIIKVLIAALTALASAIGIQSLSSCTVSRSVDSYGVARIVTVDTTVINHTGSISFKK